MPESNNTEPQSSSAATESTAKKPRVFTDYSIKAILMRAELAVTGHNSDPDIQSAMAAFNYDSAAIAALDAQLTAAKAMVAATTQSRGAQKGATKKVKDDLKVAQSTAATFALVCRDLLDEATLTGLGLTSGPAPRPIAAFLLYADTLFTNALSASSDVKAKLATRGYNDVRLNSEKAKITALHTANQAQEQAKGTSQDLTPQQKQTLTKLDDAIMLYRKLARRALKGRPQLLEKLGIKA